MAVNTCVLFGSASSFTSGWISTNVLVLIISLLIIAAVYILANLFGGSTREKIVQASRAELTQIFLSAIIIVVLVGAAVTACNISTTVSQSLTGQSMDPLAFADYYVGNLGVNSGLNLLTSIYSTSVTYSIEAQVLDSIGALFNTQLSKIVPTLFSALGLAGKIITLSIAVGVQLSKIFTILSDLYLTVIAPLVTIAVGLLFIQYILLPIIQYTAFSIILPVAIGMRSLSFMGNQLRSAANTVLAITIAIYLIYPLTIAFNAYTISWIFSPSNPSAQYLQMTYTVNAIPINQFFAGGGATFTGFFGTTFQQVGSFVYSTFQASPIVILPSTLLQQVRTTINETAQFLFSAIVLIIMDLAITIGFAVGLTKALNSGIEGAGSFWSGL